MLEWKVDLYGSLKALQAQAPAPWAGALSVGPHCHRYRRLVLVLVFPGALPSGPNSAATDGSCGSVIRTPTLSIMCLAISDGGGVPASPLVASGIVALRRVPRSRTGALGTFR